MFVAVSITGILNKFVQDTSQFGVISDFVYNPEIDFRRSVIDYGRIYANKDVASKVKEFGKLQNWGLIAWNRDGIRPSTSKNFRPMQVRVADDNEGNGVTLDFNFADVTINTCWFMNTPEIAEDVEESLFLYFDKPLIYDVTFPILGEFPVSVVIDGDGEFEKLDTKTYGAVTAVKRSIRATVPVAANEKTYKYYKQIVVSAFDWDTKDLYFQHTVNELEA